ncbi:MAG: flavin reductase family protein [Candidatus Omnitrophica bacterium]|nr:flavin reductase family protein [Candidatus Omnitrophota bacterium]
MKKSLGAKPVVYPTPVFVVGTYDKAGKPNVMTASWAGIACSEPPCVCLSLRKATSTYHNLMQRKAFTVSLPSEKYVKEADYFGMASGKNVDKFKASGLTPVKSTLVDAPYVEEFPFVLECKLIHHHEIGLHTIFIGMIIDVKAEENIISGNRSFSDLLKPIAFDPEHYVYYGLGKILGKAFSIGEAVAKK